MKKILLILQCVCGLIRGILGDLLGGWDGILYALFLFIAVEGMTGIFVAIVNKNLFNKVGFCEIAKKLSIILLVVVGHVVDARIIQDENTVRVVVIIFYLSNEGISILENVALLGVPVPQKLKNILKQLKDEKSMK